MLALYEVSGALLTREVGLVKSTVEYSRYTSFMQRRIVGVSASLVTSHGAKCEAVPRDLV